MSLCYDAGDPATCAGIKRSLTGSLVGTGSGIPAFTQNLDYYRASGLELGMHTGFDLGDAGGLELSFNGNYYLKNEYQSISTQPVRDCVGGFSNSCDPVPKFRSVTRVTWENGPLEASLLWRRIGSLDFAVDAQAAAAVFDPFEHISAFNYFDLSVGFQLADKVRIGGLVKNLTNKEPPLVGNDVGSTAFNSGNTFPSLYDVLGRTYSLSVKATF